LLAHGWPERSAGIGTDVGRSPVVHLHTHTTYSVRDGLARLEPLVRAAADDGQPALAITDHGNLGGAWRFAYLARRAGIKPIIGIEAYLAHGSRFAHETAPAASDEAMSTGDEDRSGTSKQSRYHHLTVLAATREGWRNLALLDTAAHEPEAFWSAPRMDMDLLAEHNAGLNVLTGCLGGPVAGPLAAGDPARAEANLARLQEIFGDRLYVEVMDHGIPGERRVMEGLVGLAGRHSLPVVATNDSHYVHRDEGLAHDAWLCVGSGRALDDPKRWSFQGEGYWLRSSAEMHELFGSQPGTGRAVATTLEVAERIESDVLPPAKTRLPRFDLGECAGLLRAVSGDPDTSLEHQPRSAFEALFRLVSAGARRLYGARQPAGSHGPLPVEVKDRLRHELRVIRDADLADYFLVVADMIAWARQAGIRVGPGRGSAAGSVVAYCLGIVQVDPIRHHLLFERFLAPDRKGLPDIDTDFEQAGVARVIEHLADRWGAEHVARIGTYGISLGPTALRQAGRVLGEPALGAKLAEAVPTGAGGKPFPLAKLTADDAGAPYRTVLASHQHAPEVAAMAGTFEGQVNAVGIHACGVVIADEPLPGLIPLRRDARAGRGDRVSQWDGLDVEALGLVKLDVLGLRNLDIISSAVDFVRQATGEAIDPDHFAEDPSDPRAAAAWRLIAEGHTAGVFQLESSGMTELATRVSPASLSELSDVIALFRPGPLGAGMHDIYAQRKTGAEPVNYGIFTQDAGEAAVIANVLGETYGVPIYQEQLMRLGEAVAGFGPSNRDRLRKAVAKKLPAEMTAVGELFVAGAQSGLTEAGVPKQRFARETAERLWDAIKGAGSYAFNASHSLGYAKLAYVTAYLRANWPAPYVAAVLVHTDDDTRRMATLRSASEAGIEVRGPDVLLSGVKTTVGTASPNQGQTGTVRLGLAETKGVGEGVARAIVAEREQGGPFASLGDLLSRVKVPSDTGGPVRGLPVNIAEALIEAGALDCFGPRLGQMATARTGGLMGTGTVPALEWGVLERSARERLRLGVCLSAHPLDELSDSVRQWLDGGRCPQPVKPVHRITARDQRVTTIGVLARFDVHKKGRRRAYIAIDGTRSSIDGVIWSDQLAELEQRGLPQIGEIVAVSGKVHSGRPSDDDSPGEERREISVHTLWRVPVPAGDVAEQPGQPLPAQ